MREMSVRRSIILRMADVAVVMSEVETQNLLLVVQGCKGREGVGTRCVPGGASSVAEPLVNQGEHHVIPGTSERESHTVITLEREGGWFRLPL